MKLLVVLTLVAIAFDASLEEENRIHGENGWYVPQAGWISRQDAESMLDLVKDDRASTIVEFYLYTQANPKTPQMISASDAIVNASNFNRANPTRFVIHGWTSSYKDRLNTAVRDAWLSRGDFNVIVVDWSSRSKLKYLSCVSYLPAVGKLIAEFIDYLNTSHDMPFSTLTVIGHSLGAHVAGFTGKNTKLGQINTIIGLDPALPLYSFDSPTKRLASTDAFYVESIQTDGGNVGFLKPVGKGAFYPNGGQNQPGCGGDSGCSHQRCWMYYSEAITQNNFPTMKCARYEDAVKNSCGSKYSTVRMGALTNVDLAVGSFYVPVNSKLPYGLGAYSNGAGEYLRHMILSSLLLICNVVHIYVN